VRNNGWQPVTWEEAVKRAAGRRHINAVRRFRRDARRAQVAQLLEEYGFGRGVASRIARELGVHRATIHRDIRFFIRDITIGDSLLELSYAEFELHMHGCHDEAAIVGELVRAMRRRRGR
jgi:hypothetical protein